MNLDYTWKLGIYIYKSSVRAQKFNNSTQEIFEILIANFMKDDKIGQPRFFRKSF